MLIPNRFIERFALSDVEQELIATASKSEQRQWRSARMPYLVLSNLAELGFFLVALYLLLNRGFAIGMAALVLSQVISFLVSVLLLLAARRTVIETIYNFEEAKRRGLAPGNSSVT